MSTLWAWRKDHKPLTGPSALSEAGQSSLLRWITLIWLLGILILLPVDLIKLPLNMILVDCWILLAMPIIWLSFLRGKRIISLAYIIPMWLILLSSFISTFAAPVPRNGLVVILKESYVYVWFVTMVAVLAALNARDLRRFLVVWLGIVFLHGLVIVAQFLSPDIWRLTLRISGETNEYDIYRPTGLFINANSAAFFQLLGFVPLILVSPSKIVGIILGMLLLSTMLLTGSMAAALAFLAGVAGVVIVFSLSGHLTVMIKTFVQWAIIMLLLGGLLYFITSDNERYQEHVERILIGRAEKSSGGRFALWQRGLDVFLEHDVFIWGIGPANFRVVDPHGKHLHNDFIAFSVERGLLGALGLVLFTALAAGRAIYLVLLANQYPDRAGLVVVVFLAAVAATGVESLTHQTFHFRELWLVLALQEAILYKMTTSESGVRTPTRALSGPLGHGRRFVARPDITRG